ncbi:MAG: PIN domain-containing protein [Terracidiphilus sp.]
MSANARIVLDANILIRAIFGKKAFGLLGKYEDNVEFYTPDYCVQEALSKIPEIAAKRQEYPELAELFLVLVIKSVVLVVDRSLYEEFEQRARARISSRDADDWPVVATALLLNAPIWTEDRDFFGSGIATWTSNNVEIYLRDA